MKPLTVNQIQNQRILRRKCSNIYEFAISVRAPQLDERLTNGDPIVHLLHANACKLRNMAFYGHTAISLPQELECVQELAEIEESRCPIQPRKVEDLLRLIEEESFTLVSKQRDIILSAAPSSSLLCIAKTFDDEKYLAASMRRMIDRGKLSSVARHALDYQSAEWNAFVEWARSGSTGTFRLVQASRGIRRRRLLSHLSGVPVSEIAALSTAIPADCTHLIVSDAHRLKIHEWVRVVRWLEGAESRRAFACGSYSTTAVGPYAGSVFLDVTDNSHANLSVSEMKLFGTRLVRSSSPKEVLECFERLRSELPSAWRWCFLVRVRRRHSDLKEYPFSANCVLVDRLVDGAEYDAVLLDCSVTLREKRLAIELVAHASVDTETRKPRLYNMVCITETRKQKEASLRRQQRLTTFGMLFNSYNRIKS